MLSKKYAAAAAAEKLDAILIANKKPGLCSSLKLDMFLIAILKDCKNQHYIVQPNKKMTTETKDFKTIMLRGFDKKPKLVAIMNEAMQRTGHKTGQAVIEAIIADYERVQNQLAELRESSQESETHFRLTTDLQKKEIEHLGNIIMSTKKAFRLINDFEASFR